MVQASLSGTLRSLPVHGQTRRLLVIRVTLDMISPRPTDRPVKSSENYWEIGVR